MAQIPELILASASPRRRELLALLAIPFRTATARVAESSHPGESPEEAALRLARAKASSVATRHSDALIVGCDTIVASDGQAIGKPAGAGKARAILLRLRGRAHRVYTGVALAQDEHVSAEVVETVVVMRDYTNAEIDAYVASGDPLDKAGAYAIQHPTFQPVASWEGCFANVMGLPLCHLARTINTVLPLDRDRVPLACQAHTRRPCTVFQAILATALTDRD